MNAAAALVQMRAAWLGAWSVIAPEPVLTCLFSGIDLDKPTVHQPQSPLLTVDPDSGREQG